MHMKISYPETPSRLWATKFMFRCIQSLCCWGTAGISKYYIKFNIQCYRLPVQCCDVMMLSVICKIFIFMVRYEVCCMGLKSDWILILPNITMWTKSFITPCYPRVKCVVTKACSLSLEQSSAIPRLATAHWTTCQCPEMIPWPIIIQHNLQPNTNHSD